MREDVRREKHSPWQKHLATATGDQARALRHAIKSQEIQAYYQPIVDLHDRRTVGFELLARWISPRGVQIAPGEFIPMAASAGLLNELTQSLLGMACAEAAKWPFQPVLAINVAPSQLQNGDLPEIIRMSACANGFPLSRLVIEITEDLLIGSPETATVTVNELRSLGIQLAMDDFGVGDSNIRRLGVVEFDIIKIDRCVIRSLTPDKSTHRGVIAAIAVANSLGLQVIAEGVEEEWQATILEALGCPTIQGWLTGRPMPASAVPSFLAMDADFRALKHASNAAMQAWPSRIVSDAANLHSAWMARTR